MIDKYKSTYLNVRRTLLNINPVKTNYCCVCEQKVGPWLSYKGGWKKAPILMTDLEVIGSDLDNFSCRACDSHDRERHLILYMEKMGLFKELQQSSVLHFAPEKHLSNCIDDSIPKEYIKADLYPKEKDIKKIDMLRIPYDDNRFEFVIANHVLEHVPDYKAALSELYRVLKPNGWAILQTPYSSVLENTWEDHGVITNKQRLQVYGQEDHVRLFGQDIFNHIVNAGFISHLVQHESLLNGISTKKYGVNSHEPFMLFSK